MRTFLHELLGPDGIVHYPDTKQPDHMFAQGSALYAMVTDFDDSRDPASVSRIRALIAGLNRAARQESDYLWFPQVATSIAPCSHQAAYQILPVVRFYELTKDSAALRYAERLARSPLYHDPYRDKEGVITKPGWEGHLHAWMDTYFPEFCAAREPAGSSSRPAVVKRAHRICLEWVKATHTSPFGWVAIRWVLRPARPTPSTSAIRLALELIREGWRTENTNGNIQPFVRNQLVENRFRDVSGLAIQDPRSCTRARRSL